MDVHVLQSGDALFDRLVDDFEEALDVLGSVHDLDDDGQVLGQAEDLGGVHAAVGTESFEPAQHGRPGQVPLPRLSHEPLIKRQAFVLVALANEDSQQLSLFTW